SVRLCHRACPYHAPLSDCDINEQRLSGRCGSLHETSRSLPQTLGRQARGQLLDRELTREHGLILGLLSIPRELGDWHCQRNVKTIQSSSKNRTLLVVFVHEPLSFSPPAYQQVASKVSVGDFL